MPGPKLFGSLLILAVAGGACGNGPKIDEDKAQTRLDLCADQMKKREYESAEAECNKALGFNPKEERAYNMLGLIDFLRASDIHRILEIEDCLTGVDAEGLSQKKDQYFLDAREDFVAAAKLNPDYGEALFNAANVDLALGEYDKAVERFTKALEHAGELDNPSLTRSNLAWAYFNLGKLPAAAAELRQALRFQPAMCLAHYRLGRVYFARKEWDKALSEFEKVVAQGRACPLQEARYYLMKTYIEKGLGASLPQVLEGCVQLAPNSCVAAQCRALVP